MKTSDKPQYGHYWAAKFEEYGVVSYAFLSIFFYLYQNDHSAPYQHWWVQTITNEERQTT